ncbi:MAG: AAA family ATPase [Pirellulales bacterium]|nr:AAA family ATPase [Pirellulales bacterium]
MSGPTKIVGEGLLATLLAEESFRPAVPQSLAETGLTTSFVETLICKHLAVVGTSSGRSIAERICLPFGVLESIFQSLRTRQILVHAGAAPVNDYHYTLTEQGRDRTQVASRACAYVGPAPVPLVDYVLSVDAQTIRAESPKRQQLAKAFADISVDTNLFESLGPAVNSGAGLFLYGAPGNGKSTLARRITSCFGQNIWVPHALIEDGQIIKLYDNAYHTAVEEDADSLIKATEHDRRWIKIRRPTVVVGGELTLDSLEIRHDPTSNVGEAPLQMKSNCGCLLIDDFGRQRVEPTALLNRWIVPLENRHDFLTLSTGKKFQVPFEQLIIFSTNLEPRDLVDDAFLRRIPYKIEISDPTETEFHELFKLYAQTFGCEYRREAVDYLISTHYRPLGRPMRRCQPRDLLSQILNYCTYNDVPMEMRPDHFDRVVKSYFTAVFKEQP